MKTQRGLDQRLLLFSTCIHIQLKGPQSGADAGNSLSHGSKYRGRPPAVCGLSLSLCLSVSLTRTHSHTPAHTHTHLNKHSGLLKLLSRAHTHTQPNSCINVSREGYGEVGQAGGKVGRQEGGKQAQSEYQ